VTTAGWGIGPRRSATSILILAAMLLAAALPAAALGHALLQSSDPAAGATLGSAPSMVSLTFGETPDVRLSSIKVLDSSGTDQVSGPIQALADPPHSIGAPIRPVGDGVYTVTWRTVSAVDGHIAAGSFAFGVGVAPPTGPPDQGGGPAASASGSPPNIAARWVLYLGLTALIGAAFAAVAVARRPAPDLLVMAAIGWVLAAAGTIGVVAIQWLRPARRSRSCRVPRWASARSPGSWRSARWARHSPAWQLWPGSVVASAGGSSASLPPSASRWTS